MQQKMKNQSPTPPSVWTHIPDLDTHMQDNVQTETPTFGSLWKTKADNRIIIALHSIQDDAGTTNVSFIYEGATGNHGGHINAKQWHDVVTRYKPAEHATIISSFSAQGLYQTVLASLSTRFQARLQDDLAIADHELTAEQLSHIENTIQSVTRALSLSPNETLSHIFPDMNQQDMEKIPELKFESVLCLINIYDGQVIAGRQHGFKAGYELLQEARNGASSCSEIAAYVAIATNLVKLQIATGKVKQEEFELTLAEVMSWPLNGFPY